MGDDADKAAKERIIGHVNRSHQDTLSRYLEHYCRLPRATTQDALLEEVTHEHMILTSAGTSRRHLIPWDPPLTSYTGARERMVQMDQEALAGLGRSRIRLDRYSPPRGFHLVVLVATVSTFVGFCRQGNFWPGSFLYDTLLVNLPSSLLAFCRWIQPVLFPGMLAVHLSETVWLDRSRLTRYNVPRLSRLWWTWMLSNFSEGWGAFQRLDRIVEEYERKDKGGDH